MKDEFQFMKPLKNESAILNLNTSNKPGSHWVCYLKRNNQVNYFDSFGNLKPPLELVQYLKNCTIFYNHDRYQHLSYDCGHQCLLFLYNKNIYK